MTRSVQWMKKESFQSYLLTGDTIKIFLLKFPSENEILQKVRYKHDQNIQCDG